MGALALVTSSPLTIALRSRPDRSPAGVYLARLGRGSRRTMRQALDVIAQTLSSGRDDAQTFPWADLRYQHTQAVRAALLERYAPATANKMLAALRGTLREAWRLGLMDAEAYRRAADLEAVRGHVLPRGRALNGGELRALFHACAADPTPAGRRDAALLAIGYGAGLRRSEIVALDLADLRPEMGELRVRRGKGAKDRVTYLPPGAVAALNSWLELRGPEPGALFWAIRKSGCIEARRLADQAIRKIVRKRAMQAGIAMFSPHDLRRSHVGDMLDAGVDISTVQKAVGHASISTTIKYDRRGEVAKQRAAAMLHVPFVQVTTTPRERR